MRSMPDSRISPNVIFCWRVASGMAHDSADRAAREAAPDWAFQQGAHKARSGWDALSQGGRLSDGIVWLSEHSARLRTSLSGFLLRLSGERSAIMSAG